MWRSPSTRLSEHNEGASIWKSKTKKIKAWTRHCEKWLRYKKKKKTCKMAKQMECFADHFYWFISTCPFWGGGRSKSWEMWRSEWLEATRSAEWLRCEGTESKNFVDGANDLFSLNCGRQSRKKKSFQTPLKFHLNSEHSQLRAEVGNNKVQSLCNCT